MMLPFWVECKFLRSGYIGAYKSFVEANVQVGYAGGMV